MEEVFLRPKKGQIGDKKWTTWNGTDEGSAYWKHPAMLDWREGTIRIAKDDLYIPCLHEHVGMMVVASIDEMNSSGYEISIWPYQLRTKIDMCMRSISSGQLNNFEATLDIQRNEVTGDFTGLMTNIGINLECTWSAVMQVIPRCHQPTSGQLSYQYQRQGNHHPQPKQDKPVQTRLRMRLRHGLGNCGWSRLGSLWSGLLRLSQGLST